MLNTYYISALDFYISTLGFIGGTKLIKLKKNQNYVRPNNVDKMNYKLIIVLAFNF